jgi:hypothetical protein
MLIFSSIGPLKVPFLARGASEAKSKKVAQADGGSSHTLVAPYYSVKGGLKATLMLSNQGPNEIPIRVQAYNRNGVPLDIADTKLGGNEVRSLDLQSHISEGSEFEEGSIQVEFQGMTLELGGLVILTDPARSLIFEQELAEPAKDFASSDLEGVWWRPTENSDVRLALTNTGNSMLSVTVATSGQRRGDSDSRTITLDPRETRILSTENHKNTDELDLKGRIGGISISHTGTPGALLSYGFIQEESKGFSNVIVFSDPKKAKTTRLDGAGLRYGMVSGQKLSHIAVVRNVGSLPTIVHGRIPYTLAEGKQSAISLPNVQLDPGEVEKIDLPDIQGEVKSAGLEFRYSTSPGSVIAAALSVSHDRNHVFRLPVRDASDQRSSTGNYPWSIDDNSATVVYIKNATDTPKRYTIFVTYEGGYWSVGEKVIPGGQTVTYDLRDLRDNQVPNADGHTIPLTATGGQVHWSIRGQEVRAMIGRAEQANMSNGISTTSACGVCCPDSWESGDMLPRSVLGTVGGATTFVGYRQDRTCNGNVNYYQFDRAGTASPPGQPEGWFCDNTSVASVDGIGHTTAVGVGTAVIYNSYYAETYRLFIEDCIVDTVLGSASAFCDVQPPQVTISNIEAVGKNYTADVNITLNPSPSNTPVTLTLSTTSGTGSARFSDDTTSKTISQTTTVTIKGVTESSTANNIQLQASAGSTTLATVNFTVILVTLDLRYTSDLMVSMDNAAINNYMTANGTTHLGLFFSTGQIVNRWRTGVEVVASIMPTNFTGLIRVTRERDYQLYNNQTSIGSGMAVPDHDTDTYSDLDPQSGGSNGKVYDLDGPGVGSNASDPLNSIFRERQNFRQWATLVGSGARVSSNLEWFSCVSIIKPPTGEGDALREDVTGDNTAGKGSIILTWNLLQP